MRRLVATVLAAVVLGVPAWAAERLAVLELSGDLPPQELALLTDEVRGAVVRTVGAQIHVMTRENMEVMLTDMGLDASCISEGACEVETARNLGVDYVVSGAVVGMGGKQLASLKLHQTKNAQLLASERAQGADSLGLLDDIGGTAGKLMAALQTGAGDDGVLAGASAPTAAIASPPAPPGSFKGLKMTGEVESSTLGKLVCIGPGTFKMGSPDAEDGRNGKRETQHQVQLTQGFCIMEHEATRAQWASSGIENKHIRFDSCPECPVSVVKWFHVADFANFVSEKDGLEPAYTINGKSVSWNREANGYRLPTDAEWEAAARGLALTRYAGSDDGSSVAWTEDTATSEKPVCQLARNGYGLCDMSGNVTEWVWDHFKPLSSVSAVDPTGPGGGAYRTFRGGSYDRPEHNSRVAWRMGYGPGLAFYDIGFRLVRNP